MASICCSASDLIDMLGMEQQDAGFSTSVLLCGIAALSVSSPAATIRY
jgi:hypothetical protein